MILGRREKTKTQGFEVRMAYRDDWDDAMALAWKTFMEFEAKDYTKEGIESFKDFVTDSVLKRMFEMGAYQLFVAVDNLGKVFVMISLRSETHISLVFVDSNYHYKGVGRALMNELWDYVIKEEGYRRVTVNAAPYAIGFYHKLGFKDTGREEMRDGIIYTPMEKILGWR